MADLKARIIINAQDNASAAFKSLESSVSAVKDRINQFMGLQLTSYFSGMVSSLKDAAESYQTLNARLKLVITDTDEYSKAQKELFDIAQRSRGNLEGTIGLYTSIVEKIKEMGGSSKETAAVVETVNKAIALTSQSAQQDAAALLQFKQAINSATLAGDELKSILENSPGLARTMADGLGVPVGALKKLGAEGKLTSTEVVNAIIKMQGAVDEKFAAIPMTIGQAMTRVNNSWTQYIGKANEASGATSRVAGVIATAGDNIPQLVSSVATLAEIYGVKLVGDLVKFTAATVQSNAAKNAAQAATQKVIAAEQELVAAMASGGTQTTRYQAAQEQLNVALTQGGTATAGLASRYNELQAVQAKSDAANQRLVAAQNELNAALTAGGAEVARYAAAQAAVNAEKLNAQQATARLATAEADLNAAISQGSAGSVRATMLQTEVNAARVTATTAATRLSAAEAELNAAMTAGGASTQRYAAAYNQVNVTQTQAATTATTLAARTEALTISTNTATTAATRMGNAFNGAMSIFAGWSIGTMIGEWLNGFETVRQGGVHMSEAFVKSAETARYFFSGEFLKADSGTFAAKMAEIGQSFDEIRAKTTDAAQATENASKAQAEVLKAQVLATQEAFKAQVDKLTETSKAIDERYKSENNLIKQTTEFKIAQIKSLFMTESEEAEAITKLKTESNQKEVDNLTKAAEEKKKLLDQVYQTEISKLAEGNVQRKQYEKDYLDASQKIYQDLFDSYDGTIKAMTSAAQAHRDKALGFAQDILEAEQRKHDGILELERIGMNDAQLKASKKKEIADDIAKYKKLMAEGEYEKALEISKKTEQLVLDLAKTEKTQSSEVRTLKEQYKKVIDQTEQATRSLQQSEENQAKQLEANAQSQIEKMEGVKGKIGEIQEKLNKEHLLKITADTTQANQKIEELKTPTSSHHTVSSDASKPAQEKENLKTPTESLHTVDANAQKPKAELEKLASKESDTISVHTFGSNAVAVDEDIAQITQDTISLHTFGSNADAVYGDINQITQDTGSLHAIDVDNYEPESAIWNNQQDTYSNHTIYVTTIQQNSTGGEIQHFQSGGMPKFVRREGQLSGFGGGDTVPAMLEPGEFIMRKEAVQKYGAGFMAQLNSAKIDTTLPTIKIPRGDDEVLLPIQKFQTGGAVRLQSALNSAKASQQSADKDLYFAESDFNEWVRSGRASEAASVSGYTNRFNAAKTAAQNAKAKVDELQKQYDEAVKQDAEQQKAAEEQRKAQEKNNVSVETEKPQPQTTQTTSTQPASEVKNAAYYRKIQQEQAAQEKARSDAEMLRLYPEKYDPNYKAKKDAEDVEKIRPNNSSRIETSGGYQPVVATESERAYRESLKKEKAAQEKQRAEEKAAAEKAEKQRLYGESIAQSQKQNKLGLVKGYGGKFYNSQEEADADYEQIKAEQDAKKQAEYESQKKSVDDYYKALAAPKPKVERADEQTANEKRLLQAKQESEKPKQRERAEEKARQEAEKIAQEKQREAERQAAQTQSLKDQFLSKSVDQKTALQLEFNKQMQELGSNEEAKSFARAIYKQKLSELENGATASSSNQTPPTNSNQVITIRFESGGRSAQGQFSQNDANAVVEILRNAAASGLPASFIR